MADVYLEIFLRKLVVPNRLAKGCPDKIFIFFGNRLGGTRLRLVLLSILKLRLESPSRANVDRYLSLLILKAIVFGASPSGRLFNQRYARRPRSQVNSFSMIYRYHANVILELKTVHLLRSRPVKHEPLYIHI